MVLCPLGEGRCGQHVVPFLPVLMQFVLVSVVQEVLWPHPRVLGFSQWVLRTCGDDLCCCLGDSTSLILCLYTPGKATHRSPNSPSLPLLFPLPGTSGLSSLPSSLLCILQFSIWMSPPPGSLPCSLTLVCYVPSQGLLAAKDNWVYCLDLELWICFQVCKRSHSL